MDSVYESELAGQSPLEFEWTFYIEPEGHKKDTQTHLGWKFEKHNRQNIPIQNKGGIFIFIWSDITTAGDSEKLFPRERKEDE